MPFTKPAYLLVYLACRGEWVTRDELVLFFRPDADERTARQGLRTSLTRARKLTWAEGLEQAGDRLRFTPESDLGEFRVALGEGDWGRAADLYQGEFLAGAPGLGLATFENWLEVERASLASAWQGAALKHASQLTEAEAHRKAAGLLARVVQHDPLAEDVLQAYLRSSYLAGEASAALSAFETFKKQLKAELDLAPLAETEALAATVKRSGNLTPTFNQSKTEVPLTVLRPPAMIGREAERRALLAERVRLALVSGEAGVGKSRFVSEVVPNALWLHCREGLTQVPYFPLIEVIKGLDGLADILTELGPYRADLARLIPELSEADAPPSDSEAAKARLLEALARVLESQKSPLVFDDLQWADSATLEFLVFMAHRATLRLYATVRSNERSDRLNEVLGSLRSVAGFTSLELAPLSQDAIAELLASLSPETGEAQAFSHWLATKSGGNPFFLLETLRALFEARMLEAGAEGWYSSLDSVTRGYAELAIPSGVAALVERRVKGLSDTAKRVLDVACVVAEDIKPELVAELVGLSVWAVSDAFAELEAMGLFENERFSHDLTQEALYGVLAVAKRRFLHKQVAHVLDKDSSRPDAKNLIIAEHYFLAGELERAAQLWNRALTYLDSLGREEATVALAERVVELEIETPERYMAMVALSDWYRVRGNARAATNLLEKVLSESDDAQVRTTALTHLSYVKLEKLKYGVATELIERAAAEAKTVTDETILTNLQMAQADIYRLTGKPHKATQILEPLLNRLRRERPGTFEVANIATALAATYNACGRFNEGLAHHEEALAIALNLNSTYQQVMSTMNIGVTLTFLERPEDALDTMLEALPLSSYPSSSRTLHYCVGSAYLNLAELEKAEEHFEASLDVYKNEAASPDPRVLIAAGKTYAKQDKADKQAQMVEELLELADEAASSERKVTLYLGVRELGSAQQLAQIQPLYEQADLTELHAHTKAQLDKVLAEP